MNKSRLNRIVVPTGKQSGDLLYKPNNYSREKPGLRIYNVFPSYEGNSKTNKSNLTKEALDQHKRKTGDYSRTTPNDVISRSQSEMSNYLKSNGIPSPIRWHATTRRVMLKRGITDFESSEYLPEINNDRK